MQTFAIPGPIILSILSGAIFGGFQGFCMVCVCATTGASMCYWLSYALGRNLVRRMYRQLLDKFEAQLVEHQHNLVFYLLFMRITPILPNIFLNVACPLLGVPYHKFLIATFFGLMPLNIVHVKTGLTLENIQKVGLDFNSVAMIFGLSLVALLPTLCTKKMKQKFE